MRASGLLALGVSSLVLVSACARGGQPALTDADKAGEHFAAGAKVKAPLGKRKKQHATVLELYGKLAKLRFADANVGWALVKELEPQGAVQPFPPGDSCAAASGEKVRARWSTSRFYTGGVVDEVHGKLAHIRFDDGDVDWALCDELKPPAEETDSSEGGDVTGASAEGTRCRRACNSSCRGAGNKARCVGQCRRACAN